MPIKDKQDRHFPAIEKLDYQNYLVAVNEILNEQYQFTLKDGANCGTKGSKDTWSRINVNQPQAQISKIEIGYDPEDRMLEGLKFYSKDGAVVFQTGYDWFKYSRLKTHTVYLEDGERVIGFRSRSYPTYATHYDFQLIIGRPV